MPAENQDVPSCRLPFLQLAVVGQREFNLYVDQIYATDRHANAKGMLEVIL